MLGEIAIAGIRVFLISLWATAVAAVATVAFYRLHLRTAFSVVASLGLVALAMATWAYFAIWGYVWFR